jgi:succinyl-CoA synthetase beta subunit
LKLFEFEAKDILRKYGIATPSGNIVTNSNQAETVAKEIGKPVVIKSQILVSGRGKAGGIIFADDPAQTQKVASNLIGSTIKDCLVKSLLVEEKLNIAQQFYASVSIDRQARKYVVLASNEGGVDIEETALTFPQRIARYWVDPVAGFSEHNVKSVIAKFDNISKGDIAKFTAIIGILYKVTTDYDAEVVEINPLVKTDSGEFMAADARIIIDDNALFRHPEFQESLRVDDTPREAEARKQKLAYVDLSGDIGIIGNGAGLMMATVDIVNLFGGRPANFLDIGGGAQTEVIKRGVMLVMSKPEVKAVLINILGGITRCDIVAQGIVAASNAMPIKKPIAVRMIGTKEEEGIQILRRAGIHSYSNMEEAIREVLTL